VPKDRLRNQSAYEYFKALDDPGQPQWTKSISERGALFTSLGNCYRSGISYNPGLKRYLWCQTGSGDDPRFRGGLSIFAAPEPWGPWTTVFRTDEWDMAPGESASFPTNWMSADGQTLQLVCSSDDSFTVRKATLVLANDKVP